MSDVQGMPGKRLPGPRHRLALIRFTVLAISALIVPPGPVQGSPGRSRAGEDSSSPVEILSFNVPAEVRAGERFSATALIFNNGSEAVRDLRLDFMYDDFTVNCTRIAEMGPYNSTVAYIEMWVWDAGDTAKTTVSFSVQAAGRNMSVLRRVQPPFGHELVIRSFEVTPERFEVDKASFEKDLQFRVEVENLADYPVNVSILVNESSIGYGRPTTICSVPVTVKAASISNYTKTFSYHGNTSSYGGYHKLVVFLSGNSTRGGNDTIYVGMKAKPFVFSWAPFLLTLSAILLVVSGATVYIFISARKRKGH